MTLALVATSLTVAFATDGESTGLGENIKNFVSGLLPEGSNGSGSSEGSDENKTGTIIDKFFPVTAPDEVAEAFSIADDTYAETHKYCYAVNTSQNIVICYKQADDGTFTKPAKAFVCSCGLASSPTKQGVWRTTDTYRWRALNGGVYGQWATRITGPYLFHSVPYYKQDPSTLETEEYNKLGENASAGCVRLTCADARWIQKHCPEGTIVYIYDGSTIREPLAKPVAQKIDPNSPYAGWDPTDPNKNNPWNTVTTE